MRTHKEEKSNAGVKLLINPSAQMRYILNVLNKPLLSKSHWKLVPLIYFGLYAFMKTYQQENNVFASFVNLASLMWVNSGHVRLLIKHGFETLDMEVSLCY